MPTLLSCRLEAGGNLAHSGVTLTTFGGSKIYGAPAPICNRRGAVRCLSWMTSLNSCGLSAVAAGPSSTADIAGSAARQGGEGRGVTLSSTPKGSRWLYAALKEIRQLDPAFEFRGRSGR